MTEKPRNTEAALIEMREAADTLNRWAREYYVLDNPSVSDERYDALYDRLVRLEKTTGGVLEDSPTGFHVQDAIFLLICLGAFAAQIYVLAARG